MTPTPTVNVFSRTDLDARRHALQERVGRSLYELRDSAHEYELTIEELEVLRELERLEFLAGR